jgi:hypothetical protein
MGTKQNNNAYIGDKAPPTTRIQFDIVNLQSMAYKSPNNASQPDVEFGPLAGRTLPR